MISSAEILEALPVIASLVIIEGLLSVDNALAIAAMASHLPGRQKYLALRWGIIGAYVFRGIALACAAFIIDNPWLKILGAAYLVHLMADYFVDQWSKANAQEEEGAGGLSAKMAGRGFLATIVSIELMDLSLSVDNVVAAVALSPEFWVVCTGVFIGILALRFVAGYCIRLIERFPILESAAFLLIGYVGLLLIFELLTHIDVDSLQKFAGIALILGLCIWYSESAMVKRILSPVLRVFRVPLIVYAGLISFIFSPLGFITRTFKKKTPPIDPAADI